MLRRIPRTRLLALLVPVLLLAACGDHADSGDDRSDTTETTGRAAPDPADQALLDEVVVTEGADGEAPTLEFDQPFAVGTTVVKVLAPGDGDEVTDGDIAVFDFLFVNGRDGREVGSSYDIDPAEVVVNDDLLDGMRIGLTGLVAGDQALVGIAPADAFAGRGDDPQSGVKADDSLLVYIELHEVRRPLTRAEGTAVEPVEGLPTVALGDDGAPTITVPEGEPPTELVAQALIEGDGPVVESGQTIAVHYTGVLWDSAEQFDSSWDRGTPASFPIGTGNVISGWDKGLVGATVGSQVLLVVPPAEGYGDSANGSIPAGSTLVFVVDILDARG